MRKLVFIFLAALAAGSATAQAEIGELEQMRFKDASQYYLKADYQRAITVYKELINNGIQTGNLYYNLSNTYWALGSRGDALWAAYRAQQLQPRDMELRNHVEFLLKEMNLASVKVPELFFKENLLNHIASYLSEQELVLAILALSFVLGICLMASVFFQSARRWLLSCFSFWFIAATILGLIAFSKLNLSRYPLAVVNKATASVRYGAGDQNSEAEKLPVGSRVRILNTDAGWSHVAYKKKQTGWMLTDALRSL